MASSKSAIRIPATMEQVRQAVLFVATAAQRMGMGDDGIHQLQIAVEELVTNIVEHGYPPQDTSFAFIDVEVRRDDTQVIVTIADDAPSYNPLDNPEPDPETPLEKREKGGWGVYFVKQYVDAISYTATAGRNQIVMAKYIK
ncbi:MAG: ATP-binding protein [Anaerolineaceae bacterium]|nr:ATP-binding protein [Anaerolineaceae bacterium]